MLNFIPYVAKAESVLIAIDEILYIEHSTRKTSIYTANNIYSKYYKLDEIIPYLSDNFYRVHKSLIINMANVKSMKNQTIVFNNGDKYMLCQDKFRDTRQMYSNYIISKYKM